MPFIRVAVGYWANVDDDDFQRLSRRQWQAVVKNERLVYAIDSATGERMHRLVLDAPSGVVVDHINGDGLDNRRSNLRLGTQSQNLANSRKRSGTTSSFKGVSFHRASGKWRAYIKQHRKQFHLGLFESESEAAEAYRAKAREIYGGFARLT